MKTLQIGTSWFLEDAGGLSRIYSGCINNLPSVGVEVTGLVTGSAKVEQSSGGVVKSFATVDSSTWQRSLKLRKAVKRVLTSSDYDLVATHFALYTLPALDLLGKLPFP